MRSIGPAGDGRNGDLAGQDNGLPIIVFNMNVPGNIVRVIRAKRSDGRAFGGDPDRMEDNWTG